MPGILDIVARWMHMASMAALLGGALFARIAMIRAARALAPETEQAIGAGAAAAFRPITFAAIVGLLVSGFYQILTVAGHSTRYHVLLGLKMLLAAHVFAVLVMAMDPKCDQRARLLTGALFSGAGILVIANCLRSIS
jgi:uncharacterized membrane protein